MVFCNQSKSQTSEEPCENMMENKSEVNHAQCCLESSKSSFDCFVNGSSNRTFCSFNVAAIDCNMSSTPIKPPSKLEFVESPCETAVSVSTSTEYEDDDDHSVDNETETSETKNEKVSFISTVTLNYAFRFSMAVVGALDILAYLLPNYVDGAFAYGEEASTCDASTDPNQLTDDGDFSPEFLSVVNWLDRHNLTISFAFFALWFANSFFDANIHRNKALIKAERKRLYAKDPKYQRKTKWWKTPRFVYFRTIFLQLMMLPAGFYFILYTESLRAIHGEKMEAIESMDEQLVLEVTDGDHQVQFEVLSVYDKRAMIFAVVHHFWLKFSGSTARMARSNFVHHLRTNGPRAVRTILGKAIRHPIRFRRRVRKLVTAIRWLKYIAPLIGTCNKLKGNVQDLLKKSRQRRIAEKQKRIRQILFGKKPPCVKREDAAKIIQSTFRAHYTRKATRALLAFKGDKEYFAILRVQRQFRRKLAEARARLKKKKEELKRLERIRNKNVKKLSDDDKKRMFELQDELGTEAHELLNRRLLLRPNTKFAVVWKYLFVFCVLFEISNLAIRPWLQNVKSKKTGDEMGMDEFFASQVVPRKFSELPKCIDYKKKLARFENREEEEHHQKRKKKFAKLMATQPWYCKEQVSSAQGGIVDLIALLIVPSEVSEWPDCQVHEEKNRRLKRSRHPTEGKERSWYCAGPYSEWHSIYRKAVVFFLEEFLIFVGAICFLDVFVTFFTGEIHPENGILIPKPFFTRWIIPGLLLQLLLNPKVAEVSKLVGFVWKHMVKQGPIRVYRWNVAVVFPILFLSSKFFMEWVWMPLVQRENMLV